MTPIPLAGLAVGHIDLFSGGACRQWPALCLYTVIDSALSPWHSLVLPSLSANPFFNHRLSFDGIWWLMEVYFMNEEWKSGVIKNVWVTWLYKKWFSSEQEIYFLHCIQTLPWRHWYGGLGRTFVTHCSGGFKVC